MGNELGRGPRGRHREGRGIRQRHDPVHQNRNLPFLSPASLFPHIIPCLPPILVPLGWIGVETQCPKNDASAMTQVQPHTRPGIGE